MPAAPRSVAWLLVTASAAAVLITGIVATAGLVANMGVPLASAGPGFWVRLALASALTLASLGLRALRWVFLLRRAGLRIPIRDAYIGYLSGFSLLLAPLLIGEILVRAYVHRARNGIAPVRIVQVNIAERLCDLVALVILVSATTFPLAPAVVVLLVSATAARRTRTWAIATLVSLAAWLLPGGALWLLANEYGRLRLNEAQTVFAWSSLVGGLTLAPGGVLVTGRALIGLLEDAGLVSGHAVTVVIAVRIATVGISTALGVVMVGVHLARRATTRHFDAIAPAYDTQIPPERREALVTRKTALIADVLGRYATGRRGLDVGCGHGWYVARMRSLGYDVIGIDASPAQIARAAQYVGCVDVVRLGSALEIPAADDAFDFAYTINVLHHLVSVDEQRRAFAEMTRVVRPGGLLVVHEINTRNPLFGFYMGYLFPTLNCIDEGVERWLLPHRLASYTDLPVRETHYFTFLPEFLPQPIVRLLTPLERRLERSRLAPFSAHFAAVLQKPP